MRLRNDPKAKQLLLANQNIYIDYDVLAKPNIDWGVVFKNSHPIHLEIGMGKGQFIIQQALNHPDKNFIGLEVNEIICAKAVKKYLCLDTKPSNLMFIKINAKHLNLIFADQSLAHIYLNFSDPWPKIRHAKNRLTSPSFLSIYKQLLMPNATIEFKSDNDGLYAYTLEVLNSDATINIEYFTDDLYNHLDLKINLDNISTEYENKFSKLKNINKIIFSFKK